MPSLNPRQHRSHGQYAVTSMRIVRVCCLGLTDAATGRGNTLRCGLAGLGA